MSVICSALKQCSVARFCEQGSGTSGSVTAEDFFIGYL
jgi:hypothetical protein